WFGVNLLGIGLHSYGFTTSGAAYLGNFVIFQLVLIGNGLLPLPSWKSSRTIVRNSFPWLLYMLICICDIAWFLGAATWFLGVYVENPSLGHLGEIISVAMLFLVWIFVGLSVLGNMLDGSSKPSKLAVQSPA
ncbi:MAG TPA: hypothetical protein VK815_14325, partial [Candidatus Acidoferrales bacterium]|nr:hypothetical protein [Candidatus Acidoferrales bacterium]